MTYLESYQKCITEDELMAEVQRDLAVAVILWNNQDRMDKIREAAQEVADQRGWFFKIKE